MAFFSQGRNYNLKTKEFIWQDCELRKIEGGPLLWTCKI